ncbi:MAG: hypothetical protein KGI50_01185 [Patescibacteria group bacterium]|nr:hypothetical protein [Patescibacteria group bacterium]MDE2438035.1 hypothetical protein [Patescibacteria group bacterium]
MTVQAWLDILFQSLTELGRSTAAFIPALVGALLTLLVGWIVAAGLSTLVEKVVDLLKVDMLLKKTGFEAGVERAGMKLNSGHFLGRLVYWFIMIGFLIAVSDILGLPQFSMFLTEVMGYLPSVFAAAVILLAGVWAANLVKTLVGGSAKGAALAGAELVGTIAWWAVFIFGLFAALVQLQVAETIVQIVVTGLVAMFAIAGGLSFGLGGKAYAEHLIEKFRRIVESR